MSTTGAIILAGGQSSRMGQDKAMLSYNGMTLLEHIVTTVLPLVKEIVVVADKPGRYDIPCGRVLGDIFPDSGPVGGILTGMMTLGAGKHIVVACDMPNLSPPVLQLLLKAATPEWDAVVPEIHQRLEPLCAVYQHTAAPKLMAFLESGRRAAQDALGAMRTKRVGEGVLRRIDPDLSSFLNINTPEDLEVFLHKTRAS